MLIDCYGSTPRGAVDAAAVAAYAGVTPRTVRRWISRPAQGSRRKPVIPKHRIAQLQRGPEVVERRNQQQQQYALNALGALSDERTILPAWRQQGWLNEHTVAIVEVHGKPWCQVVVTKANGRALDELRRRATLLNTVTLPTRFHAQILAHTVMTRQQAWRVHPTPEQLKQGRTNVWMADAPVVNLMSTADQWAARTALPPRRRDREMQSEKKDEVTNVNTNHQAPQ
jgi:alkylated DNA nucleotide flippase Atl1